MVAAGVEACRSVVFLLESLALRGRELHAVERADHSSEAFLEYLVADLL